MARIAGFVLIGIIAGFAVAALSGIGGGGEPSPIASAQGDAGLVARVERLESELAAERQARERLENAVVELASPISPVASANTEFESSPDELERAAAAEQPPGSEPAGGRFDPRGPDRNTLIGRFVEAGLTPERADFIIQRTEALRLEALEARYDAQRDGDRGFRRVNVEQTLRADLGDQDYEKYLAALGRPAHVPVSNVLSSSPAAQAGFQQGDQIVRYAGQRVFSMNELNQLTFGGVRGETVAVDVVRDGQTIQLYLPRGPLGISSRGRPFGGGR